MKCLLSIFVSVLAAAAAFADGAASVESVTVATKAPHNAEATFWYHVPASYDAKRKKPYPVLVYFGGRNCKGKDEASGKLGWSDWADENGAFLVCPGFQDDNYWSPEAWSGQALFDALAAIKRKYRIDDSKICYYGYSAGSQAANLFPAWRPGRCRAWVSHACGVFHEPKATMRGVPGLVTCGDADSARYVISRAFVEKARRRGIDIIWKSFPNHPHDVPPDSLRLARAFLSHCISGKKGEEVFIGDDQDDVFYPAKSAEAEFVNPVDRVSLPSRTIAEAWGKPAFKEAEPPVPEEIVRIAVSGCAHSCFGLGVRLPSSTEVRHRLACCRALRWPRLAWRQDAEGVRFWSARRQGAGVSDFAVFLEGRVLESRDGHGEEACQGRRRASEALWAEGEFDSSLWIFGGRTVRGALRAVEGAFGRRVGCAWVRSVS